MCRVMSRGLGLIVTLSIGVVGALGAAPAGAATVFPGHSTVAGKTLGEWSDAWWQWAESFGPGPLSDTTGARASFNQVGPVSFFAGSGGNAGPVTRSFIVGGDKTIFLPLINWVVANGPDPGFADTRTEAIALATNTIDPSKLFATIDGVPVTNLASHRETSPGLFSLTFVTDNDSGFPAGTYNDAFADGYWLMIEPLSQGRHTLHFGGTSVAYDAGAFQVPQFTVDVTVNLVVSPLPPALWVGPLGAAGALAWRARFVRLGRR